MAVNLFDDFATIGHRTSIVTLAEYRNYCVAVVVAVADVVIITDYDFKLLLLLNFSLKSI